tara:strand:- start:479 stop:1804 length:1326 start_codon:yes stop_codon:yes gene_type:complete
MSVPDVTANQLNFANVKRQSVAAVSRRIKSAPTNGATQNCGGQLRFSIGGNQPRSYANLEECYFKFKVTNNDTNTVEFDSGSAYSLFAGVDVLTAGSTLSSIKQYGLIMSLLMDSNTSVEHLSNVGHNLYGAAADGVRYHGASIGAGASRTVCLPWLLNGPVASTPQRYWYLGGVDDLQLVIDLEEAKTAFFQAAGGLENADIVISDAELVFSTITLDADAQSMIEDSVGGIFRVLCQDYQHASATLASGVSALTAPLGFSRSSLERVLITHRNSANINNEQQVSLANRCTSDITSFNLSIAGQQYPARPITVDANGSEGLAENLVANHSLKSVQNSMNLLNAKQGTVGVAGAFTLANGTLAEAGTISTSQIGSAFYAIELEQMSGVSDRIFSGVDTRGRTVLYEGQYNTAPANMTVDFFASSTVAYTLDLNGSRTWVATV